MKKIECPTCKQQFTEEEWNTTTQEVVSSLNDTDDPITAYADREPGTLYRCPNSACEDEVITDDTLTLAIQTEELIERYLIPQL